MQSISYSQNKLQLFYPKYKNISYSQGQYQGQTFSTLILILTLGVVNIKLNKGDYVMNIEWNYNYYQPWSDNEQLVDEMLVMLDEDITMQ